MLASSSLVYAWQSSQLTGDAAVQERDRTITSLKLQLEQLGAQSKIDKATLQSQKEQIASSTTKLEAITGQLSSVTDQLKSAQAQLDNQKSQLASNSNELESLRNRPPLFSFQNKSSLVDIEKKQAEVKEVVSSAYDYIVTLYGRPYLLNSITITFVNEFSIAGASGEISITNGSNGISIDIHLKDFDKTSFQDVNTVIHEIVHGFHGVAVLDSSALEEGMAVAMTDAVMTAMIAEQKLPSFGRLYLVVTENQYADYNQKLTVHADNEAFYRDPQVAKLYQLIGKAWYRLYEQDPAFFKKFNAAYYAKMQAGQTIGAADIRALIASVLPMVGSTPTETFLSANRAFNPTP
jgi:myosin heavy subunit